MAKVKAWFAGIGKRWAETYSKRITTFLLINAVLWIWASYYLAWRDHAQIAQQLSQTACTTILGTIVSNAVKSTVENVSKNGFVGRKGFAATGKDGKNEN